MDPAVHIVSIKDQVGFDPATLLPTRSKVVTFTVGTHGPFTLSYTADKYTQQTVANDIQREVDILKGLGALGAS